MKSVSIKVISIYVLLLLSSNGQAADVCEVDSLKKMILSGSFVDQKMLKNLQPSDIQDLKRYYKDMTKGLRIVEEVNDNPHLRDCLEGMLAEITFRDLKIEQFMDMRKSMFVPIKCGAYKRALELVHYRGTPIGEYIALKRNVIRHKPYYAIPEYIDEEKARLVRIGEILQAQEQDDEIIAPIFFDQDEE